MLDWADQLIQEYTDGRQQLRKKADQLDRKNPLDMQDLKQFNSMIESMSYSLEWMETGRQPGTYRGAEESNVYQKRSYENMDWLPDLEAQLREENDINKKHLFMTREEKIILADILSSFSLRERQCYLLHKGQKKSMSDIAEGLGVSKSMVQQSIRRAKKKISDRIQKDS
ncbi:RNA polymerase subunit sigma-70 [Sporosarcina sp. P18a]|uniref:sigma factor-like helix-turn-helix DNA-binding protein n=1 Tax=Sporosarcina sp. P18a TaxID=2048259 RepID=UPI000C16A2A4|nr:sigma factor-like helix-turn-helix DNA-binding protein [Sporosarcina sp. P18a]PIC81045.1 RNA polymerase subunit sigma-70 [Sporosarcina sp. P18a]